MQLKNTINALHSSQQGGTKSFEMDGINFGWQTIIDMYKREIERGNCGAARMVPYLRESYVLRDAWTELNVVPAKVMQQEQVLTELVHYTSQSPTPIDAQSVGKTRQYLEGCNLLFERGLLMPLYLESHVLLFASITRLIQAPKQTCQTA